MTKDPVTCDASATLTEVARQMRDKSVGCIVVLRDGKVAGLCTDRQIVTHALAEEMDPNAVHIEDIMVDAPARLGPDESIFAAIDTLRSAGVVRRAPVVDRNDELVGIVSISDISVIARQLNDAVFLEETHHALEEVHLLTGGKRIVKHMRRPTKEDRLPPDPQTHATTEPTPEGPPSKRGDVPPADR